MPTLEDITDLETDAPVIEEASDDEDEPSITELAEARQPPPPVPPKPRPKPDRDGVALTEDLIRRKAEHNEGMLSTLEEIALHQLDIDKIESLNNCRCLKIVLLQGNLIRKIENLHKLKQLDYLNLALNNITRIENLERCEAITKLDLTVNFIDLDELHTVGSLKNNTLLRDLTLMGNPCAAHWESGYRDYVIGTLPQLERFDGTEVSRTERIKALQRLPELERELALLVPIAAERKAAQRARFAERERKIASGELVVTNETTDEWCPEIRVQDARELREIEEEKTAYRKKVGRGEGDIFFRDQQRERTRFFRDDGTPIQMNTAKWPFSIEEDGLNVYVDVALPRFLDSAAVRTPPNARPRAARQTPARVRPLPAAATAGERRSLHDDDNTPFSYPCPSNSCGDNQRQAYIRMTTGMASDRPGARAAPRARVHRPPACPVFLALSHAPGRDEGTSNQHATTRKRPWLPMRSHRRRGSEPIGGARALRHPIPPLPIVAMRP